MKEYALVIITKVGYPIFVLFDTRADVDAHIAAHAEYMASHYLWYIVHIEERSQPEVAAAIDFLAGARHGV